MSASRTIVVGVDGTSSSAALLAWAREFARAVDGRILAILAWQPPDLASLVPFRVEASLVEVAERRLAELVELNARGVEVQAAVEEGSPSRVLLRAARDADYLVIGRRTAVDPNPGTSIATRCAAGCPCPMVIVPIPEVVE